MFKELDIQFLEISIRTSLARMDDIFQLLHNPDINLGSDPDFSEKEVRSMYRTEFENLTTRVYNSCLAYLEMKNMPLYIQKFDENIIPLITKKEELIKASIATYYDQSVSKITDTFRQFLYSFQAFGSGEEKYLTGLDYLESILRATTHILTDRDPPFIPSKEADVYNNVKMVCEAVFPKAQYLGGNHPFYKAAKCYKPDILIPFLNCAVEYKYAVDKNDITRTIDEIIIDVQGYSKHHIYKLFYAVFYVKTGITTEEMFSAIWKEKNFPDSWRCIFVEGPVENKK